MRAAQIVSVLFHPLLLTTYLVMIIGFWVPSMLLVGRDHLLIFIAFIFGISFLLPVVNLFLFRQYGIISSWRMEARKERIVPFVFISVIYLLIAFLFVYKVRVMLDFTRLLVVAAGLVLSGTVSTFFFKVSVHSLGCWGIVGILFWLARLGHGSLTYPLAASILLAGVVMSARLKLNAHTLNEVLLGGVVGLLVSLVCMKLLFIY